MSQSLKTGRVLLDIEARKHILEMEADLKHSDRFIQINPSMLTSWIVTRYKKTAYQREKEVIKKEHFNHQKYIKEAFKNAKSEDELKDALSNVIRKVGTKKRRKKGDEK